LSGWPDRCATTTATLTDFAGLVSARTGGVDHREIDATYLVLGLGDGLALKERIAEVEQLLAEDGIEPDAVEETQEPWGGAA
jgi:hypothetical protein